MRAPIAAPRVADWLETDASATLGEVALVDREARRKSWRALTGSSTIIWRSAFAHA